MTVDEALEQADKRLDSDCRTLAAEVRRLRAMLEPTPDARELAKEIVDYVSEEEYGAIAFAAQQIAAHDARLLDEAAERVRLAILAAVRKHKDQMLGKWHSKEYTDGLSCGMDIAIAAIKGAAHE